MCGHVLREGNGNEVLPGWLHLQVPFSSLSIVAHENLLPRLLTAGGLSQ